MLINQNSLTINEEKEGLEGQNSCQNRGYWSHLEIPVFPIYFQALFLKHTGDPQRRECLRSSQTCFNAARNHPVTLQLLSRQGTADFLKAALSSCSSASGVLHGDPHFRCMCLAPWDSATLTNTLVDG